MSNPKTPPVKKSWVWKYFEIVEMGPKSEPAKKCTKCTYVCPSKSASTSAMDFHLRSKHGLTKPSESEDTEQASRKAKDGDGGKIVKQNCFQVVSRSPEEWMTRQVVLDGLSLRQISSSEFQEVACSALRIKHLKSHTAVGDAVLEFIEQMKEMTVKELAKKFAAGERFSAIADEWTSIRNRRYMNICIKGSSYTANLGLVRCKGSVTSQVVSEMVKVSLLLFSLTF
jgi:hypothetical protein